MADEQFKLDNLFTMAKSRSLRASTDNELIANTTFDSRVVDQVDGRFILRNNLSVSTNEGVLAFAAMKNREVLDLQVTQGQATIQNDPFTGETLITPKGDVPVRVRPILRSTLRGDPITIVGEEQEVGIDVREVPLEQLHFERGGGGACAATADFDQRFDFELRVRAFMPANVIPLSKTRRQINWHHALYFARDPQIGFMRLRYNPALQSQTRLYSRTPAEKTTRQNFFPADGQNDLYFVIEMLDLGISCFNKKPMTQAYQNTEWPPYSTVLTIEEPVEFYSTENPDRVMLTIHKNDMQIYDYSSVEVECLSQKIDEEGLLTSRWRFTNQSTERITARWFALGNFQKGTGFADQGSRLLGPAKSGFETFEVDFLARLQKSSLSQFITMNIVSLGDPVIMGTQRLDFVYPQIDF